MGGKIAIFLSIFLQLSASWGPQFHERIATQFVDYYYPHCTQEQRNAFILGAIYADGIDKTFSHYSTRVIEQIVAIQSRNQSQIYWFLLGVFAHIPPDVFAHTGDTRSYIVNSGTMHHISEFVVDSLTSHQYSTHYWTLTPEIRTELQNLGISTIKSFPPIYLASFILSKLPFYLGLRSIEKGLCTPRNHVQSECDFSHHYSAMLGSLQSSFSRVLDLSMTDLDMQETTTEKLFEVECCEDDSEDQSAPFVESHPFAFIRSSV